MSPRPSLKARGVQLLAQRDHSRNELRTKLLRHARADQAARRAALAEVAAGGAATSSGSPPAAPEPARGPADGAGLPAEPEPATPEQQVDATLDWLQAKGYLDEARFAESRVHARASRYGNLRIRQELALHGVALTDEAAAALKASEFGRAREVWRRRFDGPPADAAERARQMRFLGGRGFSPDIIRKVVQGAEDD